MAVTLSGAVSFTAKHTGTHDHGTPTLSDVQALALSLGSGTGSNAIDKWWSDSRTLTATSEELDLVGSLSDAFGATFSGVEARFVCIKNTSSTDSLILGAAASNQAYSGLFGGTAHTITVPAGGILLWYAPIDGKGLTLAGGTADKLKVDAGSATITYDIWIGAVSA